MKELILLRGLPGSGKSTMAKLFGDGGDGYAHFEVDMYFMKDGEYQFDATKLREAHAWCINKVMLTMQCTAEGLTYGKSANTIIVSNTFTQKWEMDIYFTLAKDFGYRVHSLVVENRHGGVNEHGVPADKLEQMKTRFEIKL